MNELELMTALTTVYDWARTNGFMPLVAVAVALLAQVGYKWAKNQFKTSGDFPSLSAHEKRNLLLVKGINTSKISEVFPDILSFCMNTDYTKWQCMTSYIQLSPVRINYNGKCGTTKGVAVSGHGVTDKLSGRERNNLYVWAKAVADARDEAHEKKTHESAMAILKTSLYGELESPMVDCGGPEMVASNTCAGSFNQVVAPKTELDVALAELSVASKLHYNAPLTSGDRYKQAVENVKKLLAKQQSA